MGDKLVQFYDEAANLGGMKAKMRLAILTTISSTKAVELEDDPETIEKFEAALVEIKKEYS